MTVRFCFVPITESNNRRVPAHFNVRGVGDVELVGLFWDMLDYGLINTAIRKNMR